MSTHKNIDMICIATILIAIVLTVLFMNGSALGITLIASEEASSDLFTGNDLNADWDKTFATRIALSDEGSMIYGNGAYVYNGDLYIVYAGCYILTGELTDGSIIIDANKSDKIWILLDGVALHCEDDAAIRVEQADKVFLTLADDTENMISTGAQYSADVAASGVDGAIYSRDDLTINGNGALVVNTEYYHGIVCNDDLVIAGGDIVINAVQDGIHANDSVRIRNTMLVISAGDDGITVSNDDETAFLYVESGSIAITDCYEGLEAIDIMIAGGNIDITSTDDGINANGSGSSSVIRITDGDITITNPTGRDADGLDSNGSIYIEGGKILISVSGSGGNCALDYGIENGGECVVSGGTVIACGGSTMAEGFDASSTQGFLMYSTNAEAGTMISLVDSLGRELLSEEIPCSFTSVVLSAPGLKVGDTCTIAIGDVQEQITIDNTSSSGFSQAGMFGGGMNGKGHRGDMPQDIPSWDDNQDFSDKQGMKPRDEEAEGMEMPEGMEPRGDREFPEGMEIQDGMKPPNDMELPDRMKPSDSTESQESTENPGDTETLDGTENSDGMKMPDGTDMRGGEGWSGRQEMWESGGPSAPDMGQMQGNRFSQQNLGQMNSLESTASDVPVSTWIWLGISVSVLLAGLIFAVKIKH